MMRMANQRLSQFVIVGGDTQLFYADFISKTPVSCPGAAQAWSFENCLGLKTLKTGETRSLWPEVSDDTLHIDHPDSPRAAAGARQDVAHLLGSDSERSAQKEHLRCLGGGSISGQASGAPRPP